MDATSAFSASFSFFRTAGEVSAPEGIKQNEPDKSSPKISTEKQ